MLEHKTSKPEIAAQKKVIKFAPAIGDWTTYKPPKILVKKVKSGLYGFDRLSKEELNLVLLIHYRFIQKFLKRLKIDLKIAVELSSIQVEQTTYLNFLRTLTGAVVQSKIIIPGIHEAVSVFFNLSLANSLINYTLGSRDLEPINRGLTEAENTTFYTTVSEYLPEYAAAFENIIEVPSFSIISSPDVSIDSSINTASTFVCFSAEVSFADNPPGKISMGYLGSSIKNLLARYKYKENAKPLDFFALPPALLSKIMIPVTVNLGSSAISTNEINGLEFGDVVTLDRSIDSPTAFNISDILNLFSQPGISNKKAAVRITAFTETGGLAIPPPALAKEDKIKPTPPQPQKPENKPPEVGSAVKEVLKEKPPKTQTVEKETQPLGEEKGFLEEFPDEEFLGDEFLDDEFSDDDLPEEKA